MEHKQLPPIYGVYLLQSAVAKRTYIGSTPNPLRRLKQHNGLTKGGAYATKGHRPWKMAIFVSGFPSKVAALQFENAWQRTHTTRYLSDGKRARAVRAKIQNALDLMNCEGFSRIRLTMNVFTKQAKNEEMRKLHVGNARIMDRTDTENSEPEANFDQIKGFMDDQIQSQNSLLKKMQLAVEDSKASVVCGICLETVSNQDTMACCQKCSALTHLMCWYNKALPELIANGVQHLVPTSVECFACNSSNEWKSVVRASLDFAQQREEAVLSD